MKEYAILVALLGSAVALASEPVLNQSIGYYTDGKLVSASELPPDEVGFLHLFRPRNRQWGNAEMVALITAVARSIKDEFPNGERLQVGDISARRGGPISGHQSHQNGLDVDFGYYRRDHREQNPELTSGFDEEFVVNSKITANFDLERNWRLMEALVSSGQVMRIFVDAAIKRAFCIYAIRTPGIVNAGQTLMHIRPWKNHGDHTHVRMACPSGSLRCKNQEPPPQGSGCDNIVDSNGN